MKKKSMSTLILVVVILLSLIAVALNRNRNEMQITGHEITYNADGKIFNGYVAYNASGEGKRPGILVVHEWWGANDYVRMRARKLAELGYIALAVDMYGNGRIAANPAEAEEFSGEIYKNMPLLKSRMEAAEAKLKTFSETDNSRIGAIGYCFGGSVVLNAAKLGLDLKGVVSFHGGLAGVTPDKTLLKAKVLICHGAVDKFVSNEEVKTFKSQMDSINASYSFKVYPGATHAFTNPEATALGKKFNLPIAYNETANKNSWKDMKIFFAAIFGKF